jgi:hypothetical protein
MFVGATLFKSRRRERGRAGIDKVAEEASA